LFTFPRAALLTAALIIGSISASAATVNWTSPSQGDTGDMTMTFTAIPVAGLESIDPGTFGAYYQNHSDLTVVFTLDLQLDGSLAEDHHTAGGS
jgi:hypothetical protein